MAFSYPTNITGFFDIMKYVDSVTGGKYLGGLIILSIFAITFISTQKASTVNAFAFASFISFIASLLLFFMELIHISIFVFTIILVMAAVVVLFLKKEEGSL